MSRGIISETIVRFLRNLNIHEVIVLLVTLYVCQMQLVLVADIAETSKRLCIICCVQF